MKKIKPAEIVRICACLLLLLPFDVHAQNLTQQQQIDEAKDLLQTACLAGSKFEVEASANGEIEIRSLTPGAGGSVKVNVKNDPGAIGYLNEEIRKGVDKEIRECMQPFIARILDIISGKQSSREEAPDRDMSAVASALEGARIDYYRSLRPSDVTKMYGVDELDEFDDWLGDYGRPWDHHFMGLPDSEKLPGVTKQLIFDKSDFVGIRYATSNNTKSHLEKCGMAFSIAWSSLKIKYNNTQPEEDGNIMNYSKDGQIYQNSYYKILAGGVTAFRKYDYTVNPNNKSNGQICFDQVVVVFN